MKADLRTPWSDELTLIARIPTRDADGFEAWDEQKQTIICSWEDGVSQSEFYRSMKAGQQATAEAEVWTVEYQEFWPANADPIRFCEFCGKRFQILRIAQKTFDTLTLILTEVIR